MSGHLKKIAVCWFGLALAASAAAASTGPVDGRTDSTDRIVELLKRELSKKYPEAKIEVTSAVRWTSGGLPARVKGVSINGDNARGEAQFTVTGYSGTSEDPGAWMESEGAVTFAAWTPALVALRRVLPGERLARDSFTVQDVNVASGMARELRGVILSRETDLVRLEARQTILEGQYALSSGVQRVHDVLRGEAVRVKLFSGGVSLSTTGIAGAPAYANDTVRVTTKSKKDLIGKLGADGVVEVRL